MCVRLLRRCDLDCPHVFFDQRGCSQTPKWNFEYLGSFVQEVGGNLAGGKVLSSSHYYLLTSQSPRMAGSCPGGEGDPGSGSGCRQAGEVLVEVFAAQL